MSTPRWMRSAPREPYRCSDTFTGRNYLVEYEAEGVEYPRQYSSPKHLCHDTKCVAHRRLNDGITILPAECGPCTFLNLTVVNVVTRTPS